MDPQKSNPALIDLNIIRDMAVAAVGARVPGELPATIFVPPGFLQKEIPPLHKVPLPDHIRQQLTLVELASFNRYVKLYKGPTSQIFATVTSDGAEFVAVLDYHEQGNERKPNQTRHVARFEPDFSDDFKAWLALDGKPLTQDAFLDHLRRWGETITGMTDADMIEMISNLDFSTTGQFSSKVERTTGGRKLVFNEVVEGTVQGKEKKIPVPDSLKLNSEIFVGGKKFDYVADLLYRVSGGRLTIYVELKRPHKVIKQAIDSMIEDIVAETDIIPLIGTVELPA